MSKNIIILQHISIETPGYILDLMIRDKMNLTTIELDGGEKIPEDMKEFDGMFCMGGPMDTWMTDKFPWIIDEKNKLKEFKVDFKDGYSNTGIVAWVKGNKGNSDKSIGLRADFDALPMPEKNDFEHKSKNEGMMHACGHDGHTSMLLGASKYLSENKFSINSTCFLQIKNF